MTSRSGVRAVPRTPAVSASAPGEHRGTGRGVLCSRDLAVDLDAHLVLVGDRPLTLPHKELGILAVLVGAAGRVVARREIIDQVWGPRGAPAKSLDVHIRRLRRRIEPDPHRPRYIRTVRGFGYIIDVVAPPAGASGPAVPRNERA